MAYHRANVFLADCLLESIQDENYRNTRKMLIDYKADCNLVIPGREIAAIHYAAGMENTTFAENVMKLMLKNGGNPNARTADGETPIHVAAIWNRELIIQMLLDHGGDLSLEDNDGNTAINNAIIEKHYNLIPIFQNHIFEDKMQKRIQKHTRITSTQPPSIHQLTSELHRLEIPSVDVASPRRENMLTPNKTNFNFDEASPFMVNITQRRRQNHGKEPTKTNLSKLCRTISVDRNILGEKVPHQPFAVKNPVVTVEHSLITSDEDDREEDGDDDVIVVAENLFQLTESNLEKHLKSTPKQCRYSLVNTWRNKVNKKRRRESIVPVDAVELDSFILKHTTSFETLSSKQASTPISTDSSVVTVVAARKSNDHQQAATLQTADSDSFTTAIDANGVVTLIEKDEDANGLLNVESPSQIIRSTDNKQIVLQMEEAYRHTDTENNIVFYEQKLLTNPSLHKPNNPKSKADDSFVASESCPDTDFSVPLDYDTDDLRQELTQFGDVPGPITKSTKRLYMKRLIKYKRKPTIALTTNAFGPKRTLTFSVELTKTLRAENASMWQSLVNEHSHLERLMIDGFHLCPTKRFREGNLKTSFIYLLIDPRLSENLPGEAQLIPQHMSWQRFVPSIFYVGKGKSSRPYAHLYDAIKIYQDKHNDANIPTKYQDSLKLERINDIWQSGKGVVCLPVFHNIMPVEAYTREAAIIDCIGIENLTNIKRGDYYGISKSWTMRQRKQLGVFLLHKAMHIFMAEGESQLRPDDIQHKK